MKTVGAAKKAVGRPRRATLEQVLVAASEVGPDMPKVAARLGISLATLYTYVQGRDQLIKLLAGSVAGRCLTRDRGQRWDEALREHADNMYRVYLEWPQLIVQHVGGLVGNPAESDVFDSLFGLLLDRGLPADEAVLLVAEVMHIVIGGAVVAAGYEQLAVQDDGAALQDRMIAQCEEKGFSSLRRCLEARRLGDMAGAYRTAIERAIAAQAALMEARKNAAPAPA